MYFLAITLQVRARLSAELQRCGCLQLCQEAGSESRGPGGAAEAPAQPGGVPAGCHQVAASVSVTEVSGAGGTGGNITGNEVGSRKTGLRVESFSFPSNSNLSLCLGSHPNVNALEQLQNTPSYTQKHYGIHQAIM